MINIFQKNPDLCAKNKQNIANFREKFPNILEISGTGISGTGKIPKHWKGEYREPENSRISVAGISGSGNFPKRIGIDNPSDSGLQLVVPSFYTFFCSS